MDARLILFERPAPPLPEEFILRPSKGLFPYHLRMGLEETGKVLVVPQLAHGMDCSHFGIVALGDVVRPVLVNPHVRIRSNSPRRRGDGSLLLVHLPFIKQERIRRPGERPIGVAADSIAPKKATNVSS